MKGVIQRNYDAYRKRKGLPLQSVRYISDAELHDIYSNDYWIPGGCETMQIGVDLSCYDLDVNSGVARGKKAYAMTANIANAAQRVKAICAYRRSFLAGIVSRNPSQSVFSKGWARRVAGIEAVAYRWALTAQGVDPADVRQTMRTESKEATKTATKKAAQAKTAGGGAVATGGGGAGAVSWDWQGLSFLAVVVGVIAFIAFLAWRAHRAQQERAEAFAAESVHG